MRLEKMPNGYLREHEIKKTKPIKVTPNPLGFESQRAVILMRSNGQYLGSYLWNSAVANSNSQNCQKVINRAIAQEMRVLQHLGLPCTAVDAARSLLVDSGVFELTESGLSIPSASAKIRLDDTSILQNDDKVMDD